MRRSRRALRAHAVAIFGAELVAEAERDPAPVELPTAKLQALTELMRGAVKLGPQAWLMRVRTYVMELAPAERRAAVRTIIEGVRGELRRR